eukprot:6073473-Amphidinium_carterae.1
MLKAVICQKTEALDSLHENLGLCISALAFLPSTAHLHAGRPKQRASRRRIAAICDGFLMLWVLTSTFCNNATQPRTTLYAQVLHAEAPDQKISTPSVSDENDFLRERLRTN